MDKKTGILHVSPGRKPRGETTIVGNEEGLYRLWMAVGEAMVSKKGRAQARLDRGPQKDYFILRLENGAHFFRILR